MKIDFNLNPELINNLKYNILGRSADSPMDKWVIKIDGEVYLHNDYVTAFANEGTARRRLNEVITRMLQTHYTQKQYDDMVAYFEKEIQKGTNPYATPERLEQAKIRNTQILRMVEMLKDYQFLLKEKNGVKQFVDYLLQEKIVTIERI